MAKCRICNRNVSGSMEIHLENFHPELLGPTIDKPHVKRKQVVTRHKTIVLDGANIAYYQQTVPAIRQLKLAYKTLQQKGYDPIIIVSMALKHAIDDPQEYLRLLNLGWLHEVDSDRNDDEYIIEAAIAKNCLIISNDRYLDYVEHYSDKINLLLRTRRFKFRNNQFLVGK